jgi:hypothetical protein
MRRTREAQQVVHRSYLLGLLVTLLLADCASCMNPMKLSSVFADDAAVCKGTCGHSYGSPLFSLL